MPDAPARAEERRLVAAALTRDERRYGGKVIGLERVAHAEERTEAGAGDKFEDWQAGLLNHNCENSTTPRQAYTTEVTVVARRSRLR